MSEKEVAHVTTGLRKLLEFTPIYEALHDLVGGRNLRMKYVREFIRPAEDARILDIGCGPAAVLDCLPESVTYVGYDLNPRYIESAKKKYGPRAKFFCERAGADISKKGFEPFDIVIANGLMHHLDDAEAQALCKTAWEVLKPGGVFIAHDTIQGEGIHWLSRWITSMDRGRYTRTSENYLKIARTQFSRAEGRRVNSLSRIPYYEIHAMRCIK